MSNYSEKTSENWNLFVKSVNL